MKKYPPGMLSEDVKLHDENHHIRGTTDPKIISAPQPMPEPKKDPSKKWWQKK